MNINQELVEKVKAGTHCIEMPDELSEQIIKDTEVLAREYFDDGCFVFGDRYYNYLDGGLYGYSIIGTTIIPIPISSFFLPPPKMIPVEELERLITEGYLTYESTKLIMVNELQLLINKYK